MSITSSSCQWNQCDNAYMKMHKVQTHFKKRNTFLLLPFPTFSHQFTSFYNPQLLSTVHAVHPPECIAVWLLASLRSVTVLESTNTCLDSSTPPSPSSHHQCDQNHHLHHHCNNHGHHQFRLIPQLM